jgi:tRNA (cytidine/uridine-2'-O-)-methyltransferase
MMAAMFHVALYEPEMPANTGNIGRLCVATGCTLHLVGRAGFRLDAASVRRAGLDYWHLVKLVLHDTLADFEAALGVERLFVFSTHGETPYTTPSYRPGDVFLFGSESRGLPEEVRGRHASRLVRIPQSSEVRSLNLANAAAVAVYEGLRQVNGW